MTTRDGVLQVLNLSTCRVLNNSCGRRCWQSVKVYVPQVFTLSTCGVFVQRQLWQTVLARCEGVYAPGVYSVNMSGAQRQLWQTMLAWCEGVYAPGVDSVNMRVVCSKTAVADGVGKV